MRKAAARKLEHELGIPTKFELDEFAYLTRIHYYAASDEIWAEHESKQHPPPPPPSPPHDPFAQPATAGTLLLEAYLIELFITSSRLHSVPGA